MMQPQTNSIFWIEVDKIRPNPYQPRRDFNEGKLNDLAESIRQYGVLQPLVVTRHEVEKDDGGLAVEYELIAGERRMRAAKIANVGQVPALIRNVEENERVKLELAIIENLQREDLNPIDRAKAFQRLVDEFNFRHSQVAQRVGKSREYISNSLRVLNLPEEIQQALGDGTLSEGHARPLMMLSDKPEEQQTIFKEIVAKKLTVRDAERIARRIAHDRVRKKSDFKPEILEVEESLTEKLGTRVHIEQKEHGGKITINFSSEDDLRNLVGMFSALHVTANDDSDNVADEGGVPEEDTSHVAEEVREGPAQTPQESTTSEEGAPSEASVLEKTPVDTQYPEYSEQGPGETVTQEAREQIAQAPFAQEQESTENERPTPEDLEEENRHTSEEAPEKTPTSQEAYVSDHGFGEPTQEAITEDSGGGVSKEENQNTETEKASAEEEEGAAEKESEDLYNVRNFTI